MIETNLFFFWIEINTADSGNRGPRGCRKLQYLKTSSSHNCVSKTGIRLYVVQNPNIPLDRALSQCFPSRKLREFDLVESFVSLAWITKTFAFRRNLDTPPLHRGCSRKKVGVRTKSKNVTIIFCFRSCKLFCSTSW
jgi:hypothetical protein